MSSVESGAPIDIDATYRKVGPMVLRRCRALLKDEARAVDAMQDTFVKLMRSREPLDDQALPSLLYRMATQVCLNQMRSHRRRPETRDEQLLLAIASAEEPETRSLAGRLLEQVFAKEIESTRVMAVRHYLDGLTLAEVAAEVGLSVSGVRKRLRRLQARARVLTEEGDEIAFT